MPYRTTWVENEVALKHQGIIIYHAYKEDDEDSILEYWFSMHPDETSENAFDVRKLNEVLPEPLLYDATPIDILKSAIEQGVIDKTVGSDEIHEIINPQEQTN